MKPIDDFSLGGDSFGNKRWLGFVAIVLAMCCYASNLVLSRYSLLHGMTSYDLVALRYLVAGLILLPNFCRFGMRDLGGVGWWRGSVVCLLAGAPYLLVLFGGLRFAPATHGAVLNPAIVPSVVFLSMVCLGMRAFSGLKLLALVTIVVGIVLVTGSSFSAAGSVLTGDALLLATGFSWGSFTLLTRVWELRPMQSATIVSVISMLYLPFFFVFHYEGFGSASTTHIVLQAVFQGTIVSITALCLVTYAVRALGPQLASLFSPLVPVLTVMLDIVVLGEIPTPVQWAGVVIVVSGMLAAGVINGRG